MLKERLDEIVRVGFDLEPFGAEVLRQQLAQLHVVVDQKQAGLGMVGFLRQGWPSPA